MEYQKRQGDRNEGCERETRIKERSLKKKLVSEASEVHNQISEKLNIIH